LGSGGLLGMIVSSTFLVLKSFRKLRNLLLSETEILRLAPLGPGVFRKATVDTAVLVTRKGGPGSEHRIAVQAPRTPTDLPTCALRYAKQSRFASNENQVFDHRLSEEGARVVKRLMESFPSLEHQFEMGVGINTGFIREELVADSKLDERYHPMFPGSGISRCGEVIAKGWILYDKEYVRSRGRLGRSLPPEHLFTREKILVVRTRNLALPRRIIATLDRSGAYNLNRLSNIVVRGKGRLPGLLGILNSELFNFLYSTRFLDYEVKPVYLGSSPIADTANRELNQLVERMLELDRDLRDAKTAHDKKLIQRQIDATDKQIDQLVYELYCLTDEEIRIVEEATK